MPFIRIDPIPNEPIFILRFVGKISPRDTIEAFGASLSYWRETMIPTGCHIIVHSAADDGGGNNFMESLEIARVANAQDTLLASIMQHVHFYTVSDTNDPMIKFFVDSRKLPQFGGRTMPLLSSVDAAIEAARHAIATAQRASTPVEISAADDTPVEAAKNPQETTP